MLLRTYWKTSVSASIFSTTRHFNRSSSHRCLEEGREEEGVLVVVIFFFFSVFVDNQLPDYYNLQHSNNQAAWKQSAIHVIRVIYIQSLASVYRVSS